MSIEERNQLIEDNLKLAPYAARMYRNMLPNHDLDDIVSIANMAMVRATPSYSPQKGTYANYITLCIFRAINHVRSGETAEGYKDIRHPVSIDNQTTDNPDYSPHTFHEFIGSKYDTTEEQAIRNVTVEEMLSVLSPKYREIVKLFYLDDVSDVAIAERYGVTRARIWQITNTALKKMRASA